MVIKKLILLFSLWTVNLLFIGCANPTIARPSVDLYTEANTTVSIDSTIPFLTESNSEIVFQYTKNGKKTLFFAEEFCYDRFQNDIWLRSKNSTEYFALPKESITICKDGKIIDNSYANRNKLLRYAASGAKISSGIVLIVGLGIFTVVAESDEDEDDAGLIALFTFASAAVVSIPGAVIGFTAGFFSVVMSGEEITAEIKNECRDYYTPEEEKTYLSEFSCPIEGYR
jgi:hypothetical protein